MSTGCSGILPAYMVGNGIVCLKGIHQEQYSTWPMANTQTAIHSTLTVSTGKVTDFEQKSSTDSVDASNVPFGLDPLVFSQLEKNKAQAVQLAVEREALYKKMKPKLRKYIEDEFQPRWERLIALLPGQGRRFMRFGNSTILIHQLQGKIIHDRVIYLILDNENNNGRRLRLNMQSGHVIIASQLMKEITLNTEPDNDEPLIADSHNHVLSADFTLKDVLTCLEEVLGKIDEAITEIERQQAITTPETQQEV